jgi:uncharacterized protein
MGARQIALLTLTIFSCAVPQVDGASFDCAKARSRSEVLICGDRELSALDEELAKLYSRAKAASTDKDAFARSAREQWKKRESTCSDKACLVEWYALQRQRLSQMLADAKPTLPPSEHASAEPTPEEERRRFMRAMTIVDQRAREKGMTEQQYLHYLRTTRVNLGAFVLTCEDIGPKYDVSVEECLQNLEAVRDRLGPD